MVDIMKHLITRRLMPLLFVCGMAFGMSSLTAFAGTCPTTMPTGTVCRTTDQMALLRESQAIADIQYAELNFKYQKAKIRGARFGGVLGCGGVYAFQVSSSDVDFGIAPACGVLWGWRF